MSELKPDNYKSRQMVKKQYVFPKSPLTEKERAELTSTHWDEYYKHYVWRMEKSKCLSPHEYYELEKDKNMLYGEAYEFLVNILDRFDKSRKTYKHQTIDEYFKGFYQQRIYNRAGEIIKREKEKGKPKKKTIKKNGKTDKEIKEQQDHYNQLLDNWERTRKEGVFELPDIHMADPSKPGVFNEYWVEEEETVLLLEKLKQMPKIYQSWFAAKYKYSYTYPELKVEFKKDYEVLKKMDLEFMKELNSEIGVKDAA